MLDGRRRESTRQAAFVALARLTGISGFGDDADAWRVWWNEVRDLPRDRWLGAIVRQLARRNAELEGRLASLANRLTDTVGRLYTATPEDQRPALLRQLLTDSMEQIRLLGLRLVERAMLNARSIPEELRDTLRQQLSADPKAELRAMAARLLRDVGDVPAAVRAADRFTEEPDPRVRDAYLALLARTVGAADEPSAAAIAEAIEPVLELLESDDLRQRAARFLAEAYDAGLLTADQAHRAIALARTEADSDDPLDPATVRLLSQLGNEEDWPRIVEALEHEDAQVRLAAAEAFVHGGMPLTPLLKWLKAPALRPVVLQAITRRGRTLETALALLAEEREADEPESAWESALLAMSERLAPPTLIELDNQLAGRPRLQPLRQSMLQRAADELIRNGGQPHEITDAELELVLRLARLYLETARPALARGYYERLANHVILEDEDRRQVRLGRLQATVASGQTDEARTLAAAMIDVDPGGDDAIVERMIQAAESALAAEQPGAAGRFVQLVRDVGIELDNEQASALDDLADRIAAARPPAPDETPTEEPDHEPPESEPTPAPDDAEA